MVTLQVVFMSLLSLALTSYVPKKSLVKPGVCPKKIGRVTGGCISDCGSDDECLGDKKCCRIIGCGNFCTMPVFSDVSSVRSSDILDDTHTVFGEQSLLNGIGNAREGIRADNIESSRRFTQSGIRTTTSFKTGVHGKGNSIIDTQRQLSGFDDIGLTQDFGRNINNGAVSGHSSDGTSFISKSSSSASATKLVSDIDGLKESSSVSSNFGSIGRGMGHGGGMDRGTFNEVKGALVNEFGGIRVSSSIDRFNLQRESGVSAVSGSHGADKSLSRRLNGGTSTRSRSLIGASASASSAVGITSGHSLSSSDCLYECGKNKHCPVGKTCVQDGCHNICKIDVFSVDQSGGLADNIRGSAVRSSQGVFGSRRSSIRGSSSLLGELSGRLVSETGIGGLAQSGGTKKCKIECNDDTDCHRGKICVTVNSCLRYCRKGPIRNDYKP